MGMSWARQASLLQQLNSKERKNNMTDKDIIERWLKGRLADLYEESQCEVPELPKKVIEGKMLALRETLSFIDTFEVKEVDLERLINDYFTGWYFDSELDILAKPNNYSATVGDVKEIAKHFFELGLKAQHSSIGIPNIDDIFEEEGIEPNSKDAKIFKECYYMALEKLKAQKGEGV